MGYYILDQSKFVFFHTPKCKKCGAKLHMARFPFVISPENPELKRVAEVRSFKNGSEFYIFYYRCPSCKSVASVLDCYYAAYPKKLEEKQNRGEDYRLEDAFYVGLKERLIQKEKGTTVPEPTEKDTEKNWLLLARSGVFFYYFLLALMGGVALFLLLRAKSAGVL